MNKYPAGRMLGGSGTLIGPSANTQFYMVIDFLQAHLPIFAENISKEDIGNENSLNSRLSRFITNAATQEMFFSERESMEDEARGNSPAVDIGIYLKVEDIGIDPPLITVFEGKRLTTSLSNKRHREYVIGHDEGGKAIHCGGIERFKLSIHGSKFYHAGMIGYLQDGTSDCWLKEINTWIRNLCSQPLELKWSEGEQLTPQKSDGRVTQYSSIVNRASSELHLTHLWIDLVLENN